MKLVQLILIAIISTLLTQHSAFAEGTSLKKEYLIGPAVEFGKGTSYGITGKYPLSDSLSMLSRRGSKSAAVDNEELGVQIFSPDN